MEVLGDLKYPAGDSITVAYAYAVQVGPRWESAILGVSGSQDSAASTF